MRGTFLKLAAVGACFLAGSGTASWAGEEIKVSMFGSMYAPAAVEAKVGDVLVFVNDDTDAHEVFVPTVGFSTDLGKQDAGKEIRLLMTRAGTFEVECVFHQSMLTRVTVRP